MIQLFEIAEGNAGILTTAAQMRALARAPSPRARAVLRRVLGAVPSSSAYVHAGLLYRWLSEHMVYVPDGEAPDSVGLEEEIRSPEYLLDKIERYGYAFGDCDDFVILFAALLLAAGIPARLVLVSARSDREFDHVYLRLLTARGWVAADAIRGEALGWEVPAGRVTHRAELAV